MTAWFQHAGKWHVYTGPTGDGFGGLCGLVMLAEPRTVTPGPEDEQVPPDHCASCLLAHFMEQVEDEPLDVAKARGYVAYDWDADEG